MAQFMNIRKEKVYKVRKECLEEDYKKLYRVNRENVEWLAEYFLQENVDKRGGALLSLDKMKIFLRCVSDPCFQNAVGEEIGIHQTTVSKVFVSVMDAILDKTNTWIHFPTTAIDIVDAKNKWREKYQFPDAIGVIDCTHIKIPKFKEYGDEYVNRKGFTSINMQATCNAQEIFTSIDCQWPGSVHDSRIFKNSSIYNILRHADEECVLLGDDGYSVSPWLMTPWRNPETPAQQLYNNIFCRERVVIERCFGQLKARFPILHYKVRSTKIERIPSIIICCVVLHNIAKWLKDDDFNFTMEPNPNADFNNEPINLNLSRRLGQQKKQLITERLFEH